MLTFMRFPEGKKKALTLSYDDGVIEDARLIDILNKYGIKGTFNINSGLFAPKDAIAGTKDRRMSAKQCLELYKDSPHEVAVHGYIHPYWDKLPSDRIVFDVIEDRRNLENMFDRNIRGCAYPMGTFNDTAVEALRICGISYARTTVSTESFSVPTDWLRMPATCHHNNPRLFELCDQFLNNDPGRNNYLFYLWGHSFEFDDRDNWDVIEKFAEKMGGHDDIWYATNMEIYEYVKAYNSLEFSADGRYVTNPTLIDVYIEQCPNVYKIPSGERVKILD